MADLNLLEVMVITLVMTGLLLGIGIVTISKFGTTVADSTSVVNGTIVIASGTGGVRSDQGITAVSTFSNATVDYIVYLSNDSINWTADGVFVVDGAIMGDSTYDLSYVYDQNVTGTDTMVQVVASMAPIASDWLPLIVTVAVLAVILTMILTSFGKRR